MLKSDSTAQKILAAALKCFARGDFKGTSLSHIAETADTTKQVVLHHFTSKKNLYCEVLSVVGEQLIDWLAYAESTSASTEDLLGDFSLKLLDPERAETLAVAIRAMSDPIVMELGVHNWPMRPFLDKLRHLTRNEQGLSTETEEKAFALVYGLLGTAGLLLATYEVLSRMYGEKTVQNIVKSIQRESRHRIAWL